MLIEYLAHSAFLLISGGGKKIITDPYESGAFQGTLRYKPITISPDIVTVSHSHADHSASDALPGQPEVLSRVGERVVAGIRIKGVESFHDDDGGSVRGPNVIFIIEIDGMRICHMGDLGQTLTPHQIEVIGSPDILLIPVGGYYTIGPDDAHKVIKQLNPKIVIPMHFKTEMVDFPIQSVDDFIRGKENVQVRHSSEIEISKEMLPTESIIVVLQHAL